MAKTAIVEKERFPLLPMEVGMDEVKDLVASNVGDEGITAFDLERAINPGSGGANWKLPTLDGEPEETNVIQGVIVFHRAVRAYWVRGYKPSETGPPDCSSMDYANGEGTPGGRCEDCAFSKFKSGQNNSQACKVVKQLFIIRPNELLPTVFNVSAVNFSHPKRYLLALLSKRRLAFNHVVTEISLHPDVSKSGYDYARTDFRLVSVLDAEQKDAMEQLTEMFTPMLMARPVTIDVTPEEIEDPIQEPDF